MAVKPLTEIQSKVLREIFRNRTAGPRSIAKHCDLKLSVVAAALLTLRRKKYIWHNYGFKAMGRNNACYRPIKTLNGELIAQFTPLEAEDLVLQYLRTHTLRKLPCGNAEGTHKSSNWDQEL